MSNITMKERPMNIRPRERSLLVGIENLTDQELIAIILRNGYQNHSVMSLSSTLLGQFKTLKIISDLFVKELCQIKGVGKAKAVTLLAALELGKRCVLFEELGLPCNYVFKKSSPYFRKRAFYCYSVE